MGQKSRPTRPRNAEGIMLHCGSTALALQPSQEGPIQDLAELPAKMAGKLTQAIHKSIDNMNTQLNKTVSKVFDGLENANKVLGGSDSNASAIGPNSTDKLAQGFGEIVSRFAKKIHEHIDQELAANKEKA